MMMNSNKYAHHANLIKKIGDDLLRPQGKEFIIDDANKDVLKFLLLHFNDSEDALNVFPDKKYFLHKNLMLCGGVGTGKTLVMDIFSLYLKQTRNKKAFTNTSVTQIINHYKLANNIDKYTYNEEGTRNFEGRPMSICINDIGLKTHKHFGTDTHDFIENLLHARNEIYVDQHKYCHITTNLNPTEIKETFKDEYGRLNDRFKTYNVIHLSGTSRR